MQLKNVCCTQLLYVDWVYGHILTVPYRTYHTLRPEFGHVLIFDVLEVASKTWGCQI